VTRTKTATVAYPRTAKDEKAGRELGRPNRGQRVFHRMRLPNKLYVGGFGAGKSAAGTFEGLSLAAVNQGSMGLVVAPTQRHVASVLHSYKRFIREIEYRDGVNFVEHIRETPPTRIDLINGSEIHFLSGWNPEAILAPSATWAHVDEAEWFHAEQQEQILSYLRSRLRQMTEPGFSEIRRKSLFVTTTARSREGIVALALEWAKKWRETGWGVVKATSEVAVGYGVDRAWFDSLRTEFSPRDYARMVLCELGAPPGAVFGGTVQLPDPTDPNAEPVDVELVSQSRYPAGNVVRVEGGFDKSLPYIFGVDWGLVSPHVVVVQHNAREDTDTVVAEWGPERVDVAGTVAWMQSFARRPQVGKAPAAVWMDPTDNPGEGGKGERHALSEAGRELMRGWNVNWPRGEQRAIGYGVALLNQRLCRADGNRRLLFSDRITKGQNSAWSLTSRGVWKAFQSGYRRATNPLTGEVLDQIKKDGTWDHSVDALRYAIVGLHPYEHIRTRQFLQGEWGSAGRG
jgi:hypothetical protein